jgi:hypothetical protein
MTMVVGMMESLSALGVGCLRGDMPRRQAIPVRFDAEQAWTGSTDREKVGGLGALTRA